MEKIKQKADIIRLKKWEIKGDGVHGKIPEAGNNIYATYSVRRDGFTEISKAIKDTYIDKVNGIISQEQFMEFNESFQVEKANLENLLAEKQKKLLELNNEQEILKSKRQILEKYINVTELSREMVDNLIDYIVVGAKDPITKKKTIEIHWKI